LSGLIYQLLIHGNSLNDLFWFGRFINREYNKVFFMSLRKKIDFEFFFVIGKTD
jgi:hypothetical protein